MQTQQASELQQWIKQVTIDRESLVQLMNLLVTDPDDEIVAEALENCKATTHSLEALGKYLDSTDGDQAYWAATFIGRLGKDASQLESRLVDLICDCSKPSPTRQRALWALQQIGELHDNSVSRLQATDCGDDARTKRLLDQVLKPVAS